MTTDNIPFKKAINQITRKDHEGRALPRFKELLRREIRLTLRSKNRDASTANIERILQENIECHREHGFTRGEIEKFSRLYSSYWPPHKKTS